MHYGKLLAIKRKLILGLKKGSFVEILGLLMLMLKGVFTYM